MDGLCARQHGFSRIHPDRDFALCVARDQEAVEGQDANGVSKTLSMIVGAMLTATCSREGRVGEDGADDGAALVARGAEDGEDLGHGGLFVLLRVVLRWVGVLVDSWCCGGVEVELRW